MSVLDHLYEKIISIRNMLYPSEIQDTQKEQKEQKEQDKHETIMTREERITKRIAIKEILAHEETLLEELSELEEEYLMLSTKLQKTLLRT